MGLVEIYRCVAPSHRRPASHGWCRGLTLSGLGWAGLAPRGLAQILIAFNNPGHRRSRAAAQTLALQLTPATRPVLTLRAEAGTTVSQLAAAACARLGYAWRRAALLNTAVYPADQTKTKTKTKTHRAPGSIPRRTTCACVRARARCGLLAWPGLA
jgi:hypothetical protein